MKLRKVKAEDLELVSKMIDSDEWHRGVIPPELFVNPQIGLTQFTIMQDDGRPILYVTLEKIVRCYVQFDPTQSRSNTARAVLWLSGFLKSVLPKTGVRELITDSHSSKLVDFMKRALGMKAMDGQTYSYRI